MGLKINEFVGGFRFVNIFSLLYIPNSKFLKKYVSIQPHCLDFMSIVYLNKA